MKSIRYIKNVIGSILVFSAVFAASAFADSAVNDVDIDKTSVTIKGVSDQLNAQVSLVVTSGLEKLSKNVVAVGETRTGPDGGFNIKFNTISGKISGLWKEGTHVVTVNINGSLIPDYNFYYYTIEKKDKAVSDFITNPESRDSMLAADSNERKIFGELGIWIDVVPQEKLSDVSAAVAPLLTEGMPEADFITAMNKAVIETVLNNNQPADAAKLAEIYPEELGTIDSTCLSWISESVTKNAPYASVSDMDNMLNKAKILYEINNAKYDMLSEMIVTNSAALGITEEAVYGDFMELSLTRRGQACEGLEGLLSGRDTYTTDALMKKLDTAIDNLPEQDSGSNSSGGSGSSKNSAVAGITIPAPTVDENKTTVFKDIAGVSWAGEAISALYEKGIVNGVADGVYEPNRAVKREEFITMIVKAVNIPDAIGEISFADVTEGAWYYDAVKKAYLNGVTNGMSDTIFGSGMNITREDMAVMLQRLFADKLPASGDTSNFADGEEISDYAVEAVGILAGAGVINGTGDGKFSPKESATRAQAAVMIYNLIK